MSDKNFYQYEKSLLGLFTLDVSNDPGDSKYSQFDSNCSIVIHCPEKLSIDCLLRLVNANFRYLQLSKEEILNEIQAQSFFVLGDYTYEIAETKLAEILDWAEENSYDLVVSIQKRESLKNIIQ